MTRKLDQTQREQLARCIDSLALLKAQERSIIALFGFNDASEVTNAMNAVADGYLNAVGTILCDRFAWRGWLCWFAYDCQLGENPKTAINEAGEKIEVKTLYDLIRVMEEFVP